MGFEKFSCGAECIKEVERLASTLPHRDAAPYGIISGTPMESLWPAKDCNLGFNGHTDVYDTVAWGEDRMTPCGYLPACIIAIRKDIAIKIDPSLEIRKPVNGIPGPMGQEKFEVKHVVKKPLMGPDWKPAPGFERPW